MLDIPMEAERGRQAAPLVVSQEDTLNRKNNTRFILFFRYCFTRDVRGHMDIVRYLQVWLFEFQVLVTVSLW